MPSEFAGPVFDLPHGRGARRGIALAGFHALDSLRLEKGYRHLGPRHRRRGHAARGRPRLRVALGKPGDFIGRDALSGSAPRGRRDPAPGAVQARDPGPLLYPRRADRAGRRIVGRMTSGAFGHTLGAALGMGYVTASARVTSPLRSARFEIEIAGERYPAEASARSSIRRRAHAGMTGRAERPAAMSAGPPPNVGRRGDPNMTIQEGKPAPPFTLEDTNGKTVSLADLAARTSSSTSTRATRRRAAPRRPAASAISGRTSRPKASRSSASRPTARESHQKFAANYRLPFPLLSDPDKKMMTTLRRLRREDDVRQEGDRASSARRSGSARTARSRSTGRRSRAPPIIRPRSSKRCARADAGRALGLRLSVPARGTAPASPRGRCGRSVTD